MSSEDKLPLLAEKDYSEPSVFVVENLMREAHRQGVQWGSMGFNGVQRGVRPTPGSRAETSLGARDHRPDQGRVHRKVSVEASRTDG